MKNQSSVATGNYADGLYDGMNERVNNTFLLLAKNQPLFQTDASGLWEAYIKSFPTYEERQYHDCNACRHFIERFGDLVVIDENGNTTPVLWHADNAEPSYLQAFRAVYNIVKKAKVTGVYLSKEKVWGQPVTGSWHHMHLIPDASMLYKSLAFTPHQAMAEKKEDFHNIIRALREYNAPLLTEALRLLESDALYRSEKVIGPAKWLKELHERRDAAKGSNQKTNLVWRAVATAPAGFCHPRSSMVGTLLDDLAAGMDFNTVAQRFKTKMNPLQYQRPQAAPSAGTIEQAEKLVEKMGIAPSLPRRFARLDEVKTFWTPTKKEVEKAEGVFGHLKAKDAAAPVGVSIPAVTMTWDKFQRTVLPTAQEIEIWLESRDSFATLVTAVNSDAPPILQWDSEEARNPVSWYFWNGGASPTQYGLTPRTWAKVSGLTYKPSSWTGEFAHQGQGVMFLIQDAAETRNSGSALFPEILKSELHSVRSVIEAYSRSKDLEGIGGPTASGIMVHKGQTWNVRVRVTAGGAKSEYRLDRWD